MFLCLGFSNPPFLYLELSQDTLGTSVGDALRHLIQLGVGNLAVVDDNSIALGAVTLGPADGLAELAVGIGHKELSIRCVSVTCGERGQEGHESLLTIDSSLTPLALPQAAITHASLLAMKIIWSTPLDLNSSSLARYEGTCCCWQVGVKAPGTATRTTFLFANSTSWVRGCVSI